MIRQPEWWGYCPACHRWFYIERRWHQAPIEQTLCPACDSVASQTQSRIDPGPRSPGEGLSSRSRSSAAASPETASAVRKVTGSTTEQQRS